MKVGSSKIAIFAYCGVESFSVDALILRHDCYKIDGY